jgi:replicative DNA helicase
MSREMDVEFQILAAIVFDSKNCEYAFECLEPKHFYNDDYKKIFENMVKLYKEGDSLDIVTLSNKTETNPAMLMELGSGYTAANIRTHVNICLDRYYMLTAREKLLQAIQELEKPSRSPHKLRQSCEDVALFLSDRVRDKGLQHISKVGGTTIKELDKIMIGKFPGVKTGFKDLDEAGLYFRKKTLNIVAARPGMGKSAFSLKIADKSLGNVAIYSLEMSNEEQFERLISMKTGLTNTHLKDPEMLKQSTQKIIQAAGDISKKNIWINDSTRITIPMILNQCKRLQAQHGLDLLIVDYLGLVQTQEKFGSRREEVGSITKGLKNIANELDISVVGLAQLNRVLEGRSDKRPLLSDLRESGDIEQDAHMVLFLHREDYYDDEAEQGKAEVLCRKNRSGPTGVEYLTYKGSSTEFTDYKAPHKPLPAEQRSKQHGPW